MTEQEFEKLVKRFVVYDFQQNTSLTFISEDDVHILKIYFGSSPYMATVSILNPGNIANVTYDANEKVAHVARYMRYRTNKIMESELK